MGSSEADFTIEKGQRTICSISSSGLVWGVVEGDMMSRRSDQVDTDRHWADRRGGVGHDLPTASFRRSGGGIGGGSRPLVSCCCEAASSGRGTTPPSSVFVFRSLLVAALLFATAASAKDAPNAPTVRRDRPRMTHRRQGERHRTRCRILWRRYRATSSDVCTYMHVLL